MLNLLAAMPHVHPTRMPCIQPTISCPLFPHHFFLSLLCLSLPMSHTNHMHAFLFILSPLRLFTPITVLFLGSPFTYLARHLFQIYIISHPYLHMHSSSCILSLHHALFVYCHPTNPPHTTSCPSLAVHLSPYPRA